MRILIAEDDRMSRRVLEVTLQQWGHEVVTATNGSEAWELLEREDAPPMAILDWMMPEMDGVEVCRRVRSLSGRESLYILLLTARGVKEDIVKGLESGANDYLVKPFDRLELKARLQVGAQMCELHRKLAERVRQLEMALASVKELEGLLPICSYCKKIRDEANYWQQVEAYVQSHSNAKFSHGICPDCWNAVVVPELQSAGLSVPTVPACARG
ncbi:MAG: response regulator [Gemmataceae bacterium]